MAKLLCNLCLSKEHNSHNCPRLVKERVTPRVTPIAVVTRTVTPIQVPVTLDVTELEQENAFLRSEVARLQTELDKVKGRTNAERQRAYRERHGNKDNQS